MLPVIYIKLAQVLWLQLQTNRFVTHLKTTYFVKKTAFHRKNL